jgi:hypothetical protein
VSQQAVAPCPQVEHPRPHTSNSWGGGGAAHMYTHTMHRQMFEIWTPSPSLRATRRHLNTQDSKDWLLLPECTFYAERCYSAKLSVLSCICIQYTNEWGHAVVQLVEALRYKPERREFDSRWCHWNFSFTLSFLPHYGPGVDSASNRNEYQEYFLESKGGRCVGQTTFKCRLSWNLGASTSWNPQGLSRPVTGLLFLHKWMERYSVS